MIDSFKGRWSFLSNFYPCVIKHEGINYPSLEHYYVAQKVNNSHLIDGVLMDKIDLREFISKIETAGQVKRFGRQSIELRKDWEDVRYDVMLFGIREKFKHEKLKEMLLGTGEEELIEGNYWGDTFWGICNGVGENNLGKILMSVRSEIISKSLF